ncbi:MAG: hypothetical protein CMH70_00495 [Nitrosomonadaceae bacterium]|nr:hypothetical protein [Nitrosomonadaceae bacterium]|tara:strand:- start:342 stop:2042 length:1701 start_codon:yes stop_codon:yes gene_type:complete
MDMNRDKSVVQVRVLLIMSFSHASDAFTAISPPPGLHRLKHYLQKNGFHCDVLDLDFEGHKLDDYLKRTLEGYYQVIGVNVTHFNMVETLNTTWQFHDAANQSGSPVTFIGGGQEATMNYQQVLKAGGLDLILSGFCEERLLQLCKRIAELFGKGAAVEGRFPIEELTQDMTGVAFFDQDGKDFNIPAPPLTNDEFRKLSYTGILDLDLPYFDYWEMTRKNTVEDMTFNRNVFIVETSRLYTTSHCPRHCGFCSSQTFLPASQDSNSSIIMLSAEEVHDLIVLDVKKYGAKHFIIGDDDFPVGNKAGLDRLSKLCDLIMESRRKGVLPSSLTFYMQARIADFLVRKDKRRVVNMDLLLKLKEAGFYTYGLGVETFADRLLKSPSVNKLGVDAQDCENVLDAMLDIGMNPLINIILCVPESTVEEMVHTIRVATRFIMKDCQANVTPIMSCYPGAPMLNRPEYKYNTMSWTIPKTGETIKIMKYFTPWDPQIAMIYDNLRDETAKTRKEIVKKTAVNFDTLPKPISALTIFITVARLLKDKALEEELDLAMMDMIERNHMQLVESEC